MTRLGQHYLVNSWYIDPAKLNNEKFLLDLLAKAAEIAGATILSKASHKFTPQGVTAFLLLAESHIAIHTWPEKACAAIDIFTCGAMKTEKAKDYIVKALGGYSEVTLVQR